VLNFTTRWLVSVKIDERTSSGLGDPLAQDSHCGFMHEILTSGGIFVASSSHLVTLIKFGAGEVTNLTSYDQF